MYTVPVALGNNALAQHCYPTSKGSSNIHTDSASTASWHALTEQVRCCKGSMPAVGLPVWGGVDPLQSSSGSLVTLSQVVSLPTGYAPQELLSGVACLPHHACTRCTRTCS